MGGKFKRFVRDSEYQDPHISQMQTDMQALESHIVDISNLPRVTKDIREIITPMEFPVDIGKIDTFIKAKYLDYDPRKTPAQIAAERLANKPKLKKTEKPSHDSYSSLDHFLAQQQSSLMGERFFVLKDEKDKPINNGYGLVLSFKTKQEAKVFRDKLKKQFDVSTFVSKGPDHQLYPSV